MRYAQIRQYDVANGEGLRTTLFISGCTHNCFNCFNKDYQNFSYGEEFTDEKAEYILSLLEDPLIQGLSLLGGEPMQNTKGLIPLLEKIKTRFGDTKDIWCWSGYKYEGILQHPEMSKMLSMIDILVDGLYVDKLKNPSLQFRGSSNQRVIDVQKSLKEEKVQWWAQLKV